MHSIRIQITIITILAILTSILAVFTASFLSIKSETDQDSVRMMNLIERDTQKSLEKYFESIEQSVEIAANIAIDNMDSVLLVECGAVTTDSEPNVQTKEQIKILDDYLDVYCAKVQEFFAGVADYTQGVNAYYYCIDPEISQNKRGFYYRKVGKTGFVEQTPIDVEHLAPVDSMIATWYEAAVSRGRPVWFGPYISSSEQGVWICSYFVPIYKAGMLIGVMGMDIPCETLIAQVSDIRVYESGYIALIAADGRVIYHPDLSTGSSLDQLGLNISSEMLETKNSGDALIRYTARGQQRQLSFSTLKNGMKLICIAPSAEINAPWTRLIQVILFIAVTVIVFYAILILFVMRAITSPLVQLTSASQQLADADYDVDLSYHGKNEIGTLTTAFTRMRDQLKHYIEDLNHQIYHDRMTDLPNMRHFFNLADDARYHIRLEGKQSVMLYFNIVGLRYYNRQYGFGNGDKAIVKFSGILSRTFGDHRVCRFNGDQFAAVTEEKNVEEELRAILAEWESGEEGTMLPIRVGVYPNRFGEVDVNIACDRAKFASDQNRNENASTITFFTEEMLKSGEVYLHIIRNLDRALTEGWIKVYYQPIIRTADGKVCDEEALARWIDPIYGFLSPGYFIPALEEAKLIYKLDLYVLEQVLQKMKKQVEAGIYLVPQSINLSRMDFESCDIVSEIQRRVDAAGIGRDMITIEITESVIGSDFDFMKEQIARFRNLGFPVWMDDFGSGYSSLDVLQHIHFDLIKFDMRFMERFNEGEESRVILTELMRMAIGLGTETVCEGVEELAQVEFLREIGCTRIQGYYYGKPLPFEEILRRFEEGSPLEFENPAEMEYYSSIGRINLYDMSVLANENDESLMQYFDTLPMCIMEANGTRVRYIRCNRSYRDFLQRTLGIEYSTEEIDTAAPGYEGSTLFVNAVVQCGKEGSRKILDERLNEKTLAHTLIRRVAVNPVTGTAAIALAVLSVIRENEQTGTSYSQMARAMATDYLDLYYVDLVTEDFIQYSADTEREDLVMERNGNHFFATSRRDALKHLYKEDQAIFVEAFTKENVIKTMEEEGKFELTYRLMMGDKPVYVGMKVVKMPDDRHMIVGVTDVDAQMRQKEELSRIQTERAVYTRISALTQGFICIYTIDPVTDHYVEYRASNDYAGLGVPREGDDYWAQSLLESSRHIYPEDLVKFQSLHTRENILRNVKGGGVYAFQYRLVLDRDPIYVSLRAVLVEEQGGPVLIIGLYDIDAYIRHEQEYERQLSLARNGQEME